MKCKICGSKEIKGDCQYINGDYYHNHCIEQLEQENKELKEGNTIYNQFVNYKNWYFDYVDKCEKLEQENKELHNKIEKAIEYMKSRFMNCIDNDKRYFEDYYIQEIYEILKGSDVDE